MRRRVYQRAHRISCRAEGLLGLNCAARVAMRRRLLALCYHGVCGEAADVPDMDGLQVPARLFEAQIELLLRYYQPVSLTQVRAHYLEEAPLPPAPLLLTFDDGYRNVARHALPLLRRRGVPCALFVVAGAVGGDTWLWTAELEWQRAGTPGLAELKRWLKSLPVADRRRWLRDEMGSVDARPECDYSLLDWRELAAEVHGGGLEIGSHGLTHEPLTTCDPAEVTAELVESRRLIQERLQVKVETLAYPNGNCSPAVATAARECGYCLGFTTLPQHARHSDDPLRLPRILVGARDIPSILAGRLAGWQEWLCTL